MSQLEILPLVMVRSIKKQTIYVSIEVPEYRKEEFLLRVEGFLSDENVDYRIQKRNSIPDGILSKLEELYGIYPRPEGKTRGLMKLQTELKKTDDPWGMLRDIEIAILNYKTHLKEIQTEDKRYIKLFSTFSNEWRDWITYTPQIKNLSITKQLNLEDEINKILTSV